MLLPVFARSEIACAADFSGRLQSTFLWQTYRKKSYYETRLDAPRKQKSLVAAAIRERRFYMILIRIRKLWKSFKAWQKFEKFQVYSPLLAVDLFFQG